MTSRSAHEQWFTMSGQPVPVPTDEDIANAIIRELSLALSDDAFEEPIVKACLGNAALAIQNLFLAAVTGRSVIPTTTKENA